jgi:hypothetical protein
VSPIELQSPAKSAEASLEPQGRIIAHLPFAILPFSTSY